MCGSLTWQPCGTMCVVNEMTSELRWRVVLERDPETGDWAAWCPELPGCISAGTTEEGAMDSIREAIALYLRRDPIQLEPDAVVREIAA